MVGPLELLIVLGLLGAYVWALVVCGMKGRWGWFVAGFLFGPLAFVGAFLAAEPGSAWARRHGDQKPCPDCAEWVAVEARVCKHCGYRFDGPQAVSHEPAATGEARRDQ